MMMQGKGSGSMLQGKGSSPQAAMPGAGPQMQANMGPTNMGPASMDRPQGQIGQMPDLQRLAALLRNNRPTGIGGGITLPDVQQPVTPDIQMPPTRVRPNYDDPVRPVGGGLVGEGRLTGDEFLDRVKNPQRYRIPGARRQ